jgi:hypothetical protein
MKIKQKSGKYEICKNIFWGKGRNKLGWRLVMMTEFYYPFFTSTLVTSDNYTLRL